MGADPGARIADPGRVGRIGVYLGQQRAPPWPQG